MEMQLLWETYIKHRSMCIENFGRNQFEYQEQLSQFKHMEASSNERINLPILNVSL